VSNLETYPALTPCHAAPEGSPAAQVFQPREVPLGGIRGIRVERVLPQRALTTVGAWCFLDRFGPQRADMRVLPHPHTGLQTVTWPLAGEIRHRDTLGSDLVLRPGQLNLMTAGAGVAHSEFSLGEQPLLDALQLWTALPGDKAGVGAAFEQHTELPRHTSAGCTATVFLGALGDAVSPATAYTPIVGADLAITGRATLPLRPDFEYALLLVEGALDVAGVALTTGPLLYLGTGRAELVLSAPERARAVLLGGEPFPEELVMWWNFVGRDHEEIAAARKRWETGGFGEVAGHGGERIPAPELPGVRLKPRARH